MARVRWVCERCGSGVLGSTRPRKDATVRFCLGCSAKSPTLVLRTAPALERKRQTAALRQTAKAQAKREREQAKAVEKRMLRVEEADGSLGLLNVDEALGRCLRLPEIRMMIAEGSRHRRRRGWRPELVLARSPRSGRRTARAAVYDDRITATISHGQPREAVEELILHELVHIVAGHEPGDDTRWHGPRFRATVLRAARELWPGLAVQNTTRGAYELDELIWQDARRLAEVRAMVAIVDVSIEVA